MRRTVFTGILLVGIALLLAGASNQATAQSTEVLFKVMADELERNLGGLEMEGLESPYFLSYTIDDYQTLNVKGSLGTLTSSRLDRGRYLTVDIRVGDYSLDNTNFVGDFRGLGPDYAQIALDNDYDALRNQIYLLTDRAYKGVLKALSKKKAYLQSRVISDRPDDFVKLPANRFLDKAERFDADQERVEELVIAASAVLKDYPEVVSSAVKVEAGIINQYFINSTGSRSLRGDHTYAVELSLDGKNSEGEDVSLAERLIVNEFAALPSEDGLVTWVKENAEKMKAFLAGDTIDDYIGPVILTGDAAGEFFRQLFAKNISGAPAPLCGDERLAAMFAGPEFANKINRRVLPAFFDVYSDPTIDKLDGLPLIGHYEVDDAGGVPQRVQLVEKGKLKSLPIGIAPTKKVKEPNGHARGAVSKEVTAKPANLIFESNDQVSYDKLKQTLIELCQDIDLPYGLIIRKIRDLNASTGGGFRFYGMPSGDQKGLTVPLEVYKIYPDGREVPVRGLEFTNVTARILRDILQTDDQRHLYNYLIANDYEMPVSLVCPSILVEEMELKKAEVKTQKPPLLPSPLADK